MNTMGKCLMVVAAGLMSLSAGAEESAVANNKKRPQERSLLGFDLTPDGKIKSASYDAATDEIVIVILSSNYCNINKSGAKLRYEKSQRAVFGPHHYSLQLDDIQTMKGCIPKGEQEVKLRVPAPNHDNKLGFAQIVIKGEDGTYAAVRVTNDTREIRPTYGADDQQLLGATAEQLQDFAAGGGGGATVDQGSAGSAR